MALLGENLPKITNTSFAKLSCDKYLQELRLFVRRVATPSLYPYHLSSRLSKTSLMCLQEEKHQEESREV